MMRVSSDAAGRTVVTRENLAGDFDRLVEGQAFLPGFMSLFFSCIRAANHSLTHWEDRVRLSRIPR